MNEIERRETIRLLRGLANELEENEPPKTGLQVIPGENASHISKAGEHLTQANIHIVEAFKNIPDGVAIRHLRKLDRLVIFAIEKFDDIIDSSTPEG